MLVEKYRGQYWALRRCTDPEGSLYCTLWKETHGIGRKGGRYHREDIKVYAGKRCMNETPAASAEDVVGKLPGMAEIFEESNARSTGVLNAVGSGAKVSESMLQVQPIRQVRDGPLDFPPHTNLVKSC